MSWLCLASYDMFWLETGVATSVVGRFRGAHGNMYLRAKTTPTHCNSVPIHNTSRYKSIGQPEELVMHHEST